MPCHLRSFSSYIPKRLQRAVQNWDPYITVLPVAQGCCALAWHLDILPGLKFYCCRHVARLMRFLIAFNFSCPRAQISEANLSSLVYEWERNHIFRNPRTAEEHGWASKIIVPWENTDRYLQLDALVSQSMQSEAENENWLNMRLIKLSNPVSGCFFWLLCQVAKIPVWALLSQLSPVLDFGRVAHGYACLCSSQCAARATAAIWWHY